MSHREKTVHALIRVSLHVLFFHRRRSGEARTRGHSKATGGQSPAHSGFPANGISVVEQLGSMGLKLKSSLVGLEGAAELHGAGVH